MIEIGSGALSATINPLGAELTHLRDAQGNELMSDGDPAFWTGRAPLLFPVVGALNGDSYRLDGRDYTLPSHGFARRREFALIDRAPDRAWFRLTDDHATRDAYPFAFALDAEFAIADTTLTMAITLVNRGDRAMPASFGFHPAFAWPLPYGGARKDHRIVFDREEPQPIARLEGKLIGPVDRETPVEGDTLWLRDDLFEQDALVWTEPQSRSLCYGTPDGPQLEIGFPDMPTLAVWTKPGARFICIEPWQGHADPAGFTGEIWDKPGMLRLEPGERRAFAMSVTLA
jgi:galactose mutarotase-like enzyme